MEDYPKYAIYSANATYHRELMSYDIATKRDNSKLMEKLPRYRIRARSDWNGWLYKEDPGLDVVRARLVEVWGKFLSDPGSQRSPDYVPRGPQDVQFHVKLVEQEEWVLTWFCHQTFDVGQTDQEALDSFQAFLDRKGVRPSEYGFHRDGEYCAMGAEDRWRWSGERDNDAYKTPPPCRCDGCKKSGMIRINH